MRHWRIATVLAPIACLSACDLVTGPLGNLELRIALGADTLPVTGSVPMTLTVRNVGPFAIGFSGSSSCTIGMELTLPDGTITGRRQACTSDLRTWLLEPGESVVREGPLTWASLPGDTSYGRDAGPPAGSYRLRPYIDAQEGEHSGPAVPLEVLPWARARLVHTYPDLTALDLVVSERAAVTGLSPGSASPRGFVGTGPRTVEIRETGSTATVARGQFEFQQGKRYVFAIRATAAGPQLWLITDPDTVAGSGESRLRLVHLATGAPGIAVQLTAPDGTEKLAATVPLPYGTASPYLASAPGSWHVVVTTTNRADTLARFNLSVLAGQARTLMLIDENAGALVGLLLEP